MGAGKRTIAERDTMYGDAYALTGIVLQPIMGHLIELLSSQPEKFLPFVMIVNKLMRIITSPNNIDHWVDIAGYAELVARDLRAHKGMNDAEEDKIQFGVD